ncbi:MAG: hypothetical protein M1816_006601 [Peltula sp. TS41687]|nr:MAG: hypothetical protein M1816_006601 [Peltula sp. TS41687]
MEESTLAAILAVPDPDEAKYAPFAAQRLRRSERVQTTPNYFACSSSVTDPNSDRNVTSGIADDTTTIQKGRLASRKASSSSPAFAKRASGGVTKRSQKFSKGRMPMGRAPKAGARRSAGRLNTPPDSPQSENREGALTQPAMLSSPPVSQSSSNNTGQDSGSRYSESDVQDTQMTDIVYASEVHPEVERATTFETEHVSTDTAVNQLEIEADVGVLAVTDQMMVIPNGSADHDGASAMDVDHGSAETEDDTLSVKEDTDSIDNITTLKAETMTVPQPGEKLVTCVEIAKSEGLLRKEYDSAVVRRINGRYLVPQKCLECIVANEFCDRSQPCQSCTNKDLNCTRDPAGYMVVATAKAVFACPPLPSVPPTRNNHTNAMNAPIARPQPVGQPKVWAETRTALCETLPYFRAFQSAAYLQNGLCLALMVDRQGSERDAFTENVVITRCGGGMSRVNGEMTQTSDQTSESTVVQSLLANLEQKVPVVLIVGSGNQFCPTVIPHRYCVMDYFHITKIWCEKAGRMDCYMFRFERILQEIPSWWSPSGRLEPATPPANDMEMPVHATCLFCEKDEVQIYTAGWMCLNEKCGAFWTIDLTPPRSPLRHTNYFLNHRVGYDWRNRRPPCQLAPELVKPVEGGSFAVGRHCWKGILCQRCGGCIPRVDWHEWKCQTPGCDFRYTIPFTPLQVAEVSDPHGIPLRGHAAPTTKFLDPITVSHRFTDNYRINTYHIPRCGTVTHFQANWNINERAGGPDDMFLDLQQVDLGLKRFPLTNSQLPGGLTAHFAVNYGMPYKYVVAVDSKPFSEAPKEILKALHRLTWAGEQCVTDGSFRKFNELLTVGYFQEQKMGFHDDGERTLGPTIATMSLGAEATMSFRMKKAPWSGFSKGGNYQRDEEPLPGCRLYEKRKELYDMRGNEDNQSQIRRIVLMNEIGRGAPPGYAPIVIKMILKHGDLLVMHGANIQKYYEHSVHNSGKLRFALTCRYIRPELIEEDQHYKGDYVCNDDYQYDGDISGTDITIPNNGSGWGYPGAPATMDGVDGLPDDSPTLSRLPPVLVNHPVAPQFELMRQHDPYHG